MRIREISVSKVETLAHALACDEFGFDQPISNFSEVDLGKLESCVKTPFQTWGKKPLYEGLLGKAAILFYLMDKNHAFPNGNKRIAVTTLLTFLYLNNKWLKSDKEELYKFAVWVAESPASGKDEIVTVVEKFIRQKIVELRK